MKTSCSHWSDGKRALLRLSDSSLLQSTAVAAGLLRAGKLGEELEVPLVERLHVL
jgi:hypothetical protein